MAELCHKCAGSPDEMAAVQVKIANKKENLGYGSGIRFGDPELRLRHNVFTNMDPQLAARAHWSG